MESWTAGCKKIVFRPDRGGRVPPLWINAHTESNCIFAKNSIPPLLIYLTSNPCDRACSFWMDTRCSVRAQYVAIWSRYNDFNNDKNLSLNLCHTVGRLFTCPTKRIKQNQDNMGNFLENVSRCLGYIM